VDIGLLASDMCAGAHILGGVCMWVILEMNVYKQTGENQT